MGNVTLDTTNFSEQLGVYDFFNVLLAGATFVFGLCIINSNVYSFLWGDISLGQGLALVLLIYIVGLILQEFGSTLDRIVLDLYVGMNRRILRGNVDFVYPDYTSEQGKNRFKEKTRNVVNRLRRSRSNDIIGNPLLLQQYRKYADNLVAEFIDINNPQRFDHKDVNGFMFSVCQYYVSVCGKDRKVEKMRALFNMSKTLFACFLALAVCAFISLLFENSNVTVTIGEIIGIPPCSFTAFVSKIIWGIGFAGIAAVFYCRAKKQCIDFY